MKELLWPPKKEDLERLYLVERLSAAKIGRLYGLKHPNPKSSETLVLFYLKKFTIQRRDKAEHIKKVTTAMVGDWVRRYQAGESLKQIAGSEVDAVTVWNHLKRRGIILRDKVEAQIKAVSKYERRPFSGDNIERAYLMGLRYGDLHVVRHGRAIRVRVSTTHPAMADLFESMFSPYGHVSKYPRVASLVKFEWSLECDLDCSLDFLLPKPSKEILDLFTDQEFGAFLGGIFDAEGSIQMHKKVSRYNPELSISNGDPDLLEFVSSRLRRAGYHPKVRWVEQQFDRKGVASKSRIGRIEIFRFLEAQGLLRAMPIRHPEKVAKREIALELEYGSLNQSIQVTKWKSLSEEIHGQTKEFVSAAKKEIQKRAEVKPSLLTSER